MARTSKAGRRGNRRSGERRKRWTAAEGREAVATWAASGESVAAFCRGRGIHPERLRRWRQRLGATAEGVAERPAVEGWVQAVVTGGDDRPAAVVVQVGSGGRIEIGDPGCVDAEWVAKLAKGLVQAGR